MAALVAGLAAAALLRVRGKTVFGIVLVASLLLSALFTGATLGLAFVSRSPDRGAAGFWLPMRLILGGMVSVDQNFRRGKNPEADSQG